MAEDRVTEAMRATPRAPFLPAHARADAHYDGPIPIGHGATCSQPSTVRSMLALLDVPAGARVLDVGSGSGWTTAILARLVGPEGAVLGVDVVPELVERAAARLDEEELSWANVRMAERGVLGLPAEAPFNRILVSAMGDSVPRALVDQLTPDGTMVLPAGGRMLRVTRDGERWREEAAPGRYTFVPLQ